MLADTVVGAINKGLSAVFGNRNDRLIAELEPVVEEVSRLDEAFSSLSDEQLRRKTDEFRERLRPYTGKVEEARRAQVRANRALMRARSRGERKGLQNLLTQAEYALTDAKAERNRVLDEVLPEAFAVVRQACRRLVGKQWTASDIPIYWQDVPYDVQVIGGIVLHQGKIAEMVTGEGKTLVATMPAYLNALVGKVHIVTVNDFLARRDRDWMAPVYEMLGLTAGAIQSNMPDEERQAAYACDIVYGKENEFGFDYLRDNMKPSLQMQCQKGRLDYAIVDEIDSILIDDARTPLIISGPAFDTTSKYFEADRIARQLKRGRDFEVKEKEETVALTEEGVERAQRLAGVESFYTGENMDWPHLLSQALRAQHLYKRDIKYVVEDGEVVIVDERTGRLQHGRVWADGLHQAIEAKERLQIREETQTMATVTVQNFFRMYDKLAGMTGTAATEANEFHEIYGLDVVIIPTNRPLRRTNFPDRVFLREKDKWRAALDEIEEVHATGRPVLVGTVSIEKNEQVSKMLAQRGIPHEALNAKQHQREAQVVAQAGQPGAVTVATNMAGRGTDIKLGPGVAEMGGLHIIGTERHEARRIDNQLRGRAGRQGDPGSSRFYVSLEDDLMRVFAGDWVRNVLGKFGMDDGMPLDSRMVSNQIEKAQKRVEEYYFDGRKNLLEYDDVMNEQRTIVYEQRQEILRGEYLKETVRDMLRDVIDEQVVLHLEDLDYRGLRQWCRNHLGIDVPVDDIVDRGEEEVREALYQRALARYEEREETLGPEDMRQLEQFVLLQTLDMKWKDHLYAMDQLRGQIGFRGYAQKDPKLEYKREGYELFDMMIWSVKEEVTRLLFRLELAPQTAEQRRDIWRANQAVHREFQSFDAQRDQAVASSQQGEDKATPFVRPDVRVGRNDPCPCGSGRKYKKCCGRSA